MCTARLAEHTKNRLSAPEADLAPEAVSGGQSLFDSSKPPGLAIRFAAEAVLRLRLWRAACPVNGSEWYKMD